MRKITFWQNNPSQHQSALMRSLAAQSDFAVTLVCQEGLTRRRRSMGWYLPSYDNAEVVIAPTSREIQRVLSADPQQTAHIFSVTRGYPMVWYALQQALKTNLKLGIYSEASDWRGAKGLLRLGRARFDHARFGNRMSFILAIGHLAVKWFRMCGYAEDRIFPFGYFVEMPMLSKTRAITAPSFNTDLQIIFIGQCIHRKGVDILLHALKDLLYLDWQLTIIGDGHDRNALEALSHHLGLGSRVRFLGTLPNSVAMEHLAAADLLILPSRWDGWGAVINEALMLGVPAICSSTCGATDLLSNEERGRVFISESVEDLQQQIYSQFASDQYSLQRRAVIQEWAERTITGDIAAQYLLSIINWSLQTENQLPEAPWLKG